MAFDKFSISMKKPPQHCSFQAGNETAPSTPAFRSRSPAETAKIKSRARRRCVRKDEYNVDHGEHMRTVPVPSRKRHSTTHPPLSAADINAGTQCFVLNNDSQPSQRRRAGSDRETKAKSGQDQAIHHARAHGNEKGHQRAKLPLDAWIASTVEERRLSGRALMRDPDEQSHAAIVL